MNRKIILLTVILLAFSANATAAGNYTEMTSQIEEADQAINQMENADIPTERVESLLTTANRSFIAQRNLAENQDIEPDFSRARELTEQILDIKQTAMRVNDRMNSLEERIDKLEETDLNLTGVKQAYSEVNNTFQNQRFEEAENQVENVYSEISEARSVQTQVQAFASAQRQNLETIYEESVDYTIDNWKKISVATVAGLILLIIIFREYKLWKLEKRRENKMEKKEVIEDMIEEAQQEYYVKGKGSKIAFNTRMDKFQEMKRDTEQEINELESSLHSIKGLPVISPEIKDEAEDFQAEGEVMEEAGEVKGSLERISERREQEEQPEKEKDQDSSEDKTEESEEEAGNEDKEQYNDLLEQDNVKEAKDEIEGLEDPDYRLLLEVEKSNKDRKTLKEYLKDNIQPELEGVDYTEKEEELLEQDTVKEARDEIKELEEPDYRALLKAEKAGKDRKTLKEYIKEQIRFE